MKSIIRNFLAKMMAGRSDDGIMITLRDPQKVELAENVLMDLLLRNGIDPNAIKSEQQLKNIINQIEAASKQTTQTGIRNTESAKVFDLEGKEIPKGSKIIGGKAIKPIDELENYTKSKEDIVQDLVDQKFGKNYFDDLPPPGSRGGKDDIAAPVMDVEDAPPGFIDFVRKTDPEGADKLQKVEDEIKAAIEAGNKRAAENLRKKKKKKKKDDDPEKKAEGGIMRLGFKDGMNRRTFLKLLTGLAAVPIIGKVLKPLKMGKTVTKVPIIKTGDVPGKPEWFDQLVNKVILEGDDVTKKFATQERQVVHMKKIDDDTSVTVTQDLNDGSIMVDVDDPIRNVMGEGPNFNPDTSLLMRLKKGQADETTKGTPADEFDFTENDMRNYMDGPDDYTTEFTENTVNKMSDLTSDLSKIESYATGKGPTMKQIVESKKRREMVKLAEENPAEYASGRGPEFDPPEPDDFASGGIARMLGE